MVTLNSKNSRKMMSIGMACLSAGLLASLLIHPATPTSTRVLHFSAGLLIGMSIVLNLAGVGITTLQRRCKS